jgi:peroxiredoxin
MNRFRNPSGIAARAAGLLLLAGAVGCSKSEPTASAAPLAASVAPMAASSAPMIASAAPDPNASHLLPYETTASDRLGVLAPNTGIRVGQTVPDGTLVDLDGKEVTLSSLYNAGPILLAFYRGGWCPYCNTEIHSLTQAYPEYQKRGVTPVAVSVDKPEQGAKLKATYVIPFPVLSDSDAKLLNSFHVARQVGDEELGKLKGFGVDLEAYSGKTHHQMAIPSLFVIDRTGTVRFAHSDPDFKTRPSTAQLLAAIDALKLAH